MSHLLPLRELLDDLRADRIDERDIPWVLRCFGDGFIMEAEEDIEELVGHDSPRVRAAAIEVLALRWRISEYRAVCEYVLRYDEDAHVRSVAARGLGALLARTRDKDALRQLLERVRDAGESRGVREAAYLAALDVIGAAPRHSKAKRFSPRRDVDWNLVDTLLEESGTVKRCTRCGTPLVRPGDGPAWCLDCTLDILEVSRYTTEAMHRHMMGLD
jgi:hypothetical protein